MRLHAALLLILLAGCDTDFLVVQISSHELCYTEAGIEIPAAEDGGVYVATLEQDAIELPLPDSFTREAHLRTLRVRPNSGVTDLGFLEELQVEVRVADPAVELPQVGLVDYSRPINNSTIGGHPIIDELVFEGDPELDIAQYVDAGALEYVLAVGPIPSYEWSLDLEACFDLAVEYRRSLDE